MCPTQLLLSSVTPPVTACGPVGARLRRERRGRSPQWGPCRTSGPLTAGGTLLRSESPSVSSCH